MIYHFKGKEWKRKLFLSAVQNIQLRWNTLQVRCRYIICGVFMCRHYASDINFFLNQHFFKSDLQMFQKVSEEIRSLLKGVRLRSIGTM